MTKNVSDDVGSIQESIAIPFVTGGHQRARAERWLEARVKRGEREQFAEFGELTPELAALLLERNPTHENRAFRAATADKYASDISAGRWALNGEPIIIAVTGELNDGQHRCSAVVAAGKSIPVLFAFGMSRDSRLTTDQGIQKTAGDFLGMEGIANANHLAAIAGNLIEISRFGKISTTAADRPSKSEIRERVLNDPDIDVSFKFVRRTGAARIAAFTLLGTAHYLCAKVNRDDANAFFDKLIEGTELKARDPVFVVREKLIARDARLTKNERLKALLMAWNNMRTHKSVKTLTHRVARGEKLPGVK